MTVNPNVDGWIYQNPKSPTNTPKNKKKLLKTKRILKLKYKPSRGLSFTFTVAGRRGQFAPPAAAGRPKYRKDFH